MIRAPTDDFDITIIGGGPAGATAGRQLAKLGHRVCLVERRCFPRQHVGESLPPSILPLLESLQLRDRIEAAGFLRCGPARVEWAGVPSQFQVMSDSERGFQVDRGRFDAILLAAAVEAGVRVVQPGIVSRPLRQSAKRWIVPVRTPRATWMLHTRFLIDATGRKGFLRTGTRVRHGARTLALYAYWRAPRLSGAETRVEAGTDCWYWGAPLPDGTFNATVFLDFDRRKDLQASGLDSFYRRLIEASNLLRPCNDGAIVGKVMACDATCSSTAPAAGIDWCKVGEAAFSLDPLSSQGVQAAVSTGVRASVVVNTILQKPSSRQLAIDFYRQRLRATLANHRIACSEMYRRQWAALDSDFWAKRWRREAVKHGVLGRTRPIPDGTVKIRLAPHVRVIETGVIMNDLVIPAEAVVSRDIDEPIAFVDGVQLAPVIQLIEKGIRVDDLLQVLSARLPKTQSVNIFKWLWNCGVAEHIPRVG